MKYRTYSYHRKRRADQLRALASHQRAAYRVLRKGFRFLDEVHERLCEARDLASPERNKALLPYAVFAVDKGRRLCYGVHSLMLDGLDEEAGALQRTLLEAVEALHWLMQEPSRALIIRDGQLPRAGERAQEVGSPFWDAKSALSERSSHFAFPSSLNDSELPRKQREGGDKLPSVGASVPVNMVQIGIAAVGVLAAAGEPNHDLADRLEALRDEAFRTFGIVAIPGFGIPNDIPRERRWDYKYPGDIPIQRFP